MVDMRASSYKKKAEKRGAISASKKSSGGSSGKTFKSSSKKSSSKSSKKSSKETTTKKTPEVLSTSRTTETGSIVVTKSGKVTEFDKKGKITRRYQTSPDEAKTFLRENKITMSDVRRNKTYTQRVIDTARKRGIRYSVDNKTGVVTLYEGDRKTIVKPPLEPSITPYGQSVSVPRSATVAPSVFQLPKRIRDAKIREQNSLKNISVMQKGVADVFSKMKGKKTIKTDKYGNLIINYKGRKIVLDPQGNYVDIPQSAKITSNTAAQLGNKFNNTPSAQQYFKNLYSQKNLQASSKRVGAVAGLFGKEVNTRDYITALAGLNIVTNKRKTELIKQYANVNRADILKQEGMKKGFEGALQRAEIVKLEQFSKSQKQLANGNLGSYAWTRAGVMGILGVGTALVEIATAVRHPVKTAQGLYGAVTQPVTTVKYLRDEFLINPVGTMTNFYTWNKVITGFGKLGRRSKVGRWVKEELFIRRLPKPFQLPVRKILESSKVQSKINPSKVPKPKKVSFIDVKELNAIDALALKKTLTKTDSVVFGSKAGKIFEPPGKNILPKPKDVDIAVSNPISFYNEFLKNLPKSSRRYYTLKGEKLYHVKRGKIFDVKPISRLIPDKGFISKTGWLPVAGLQKGLAFTKGKLIPKLQWIVKESKLEIPTQKLIQIQGIKFVSISEQTLRKGLGTIQVLIERNTKRFKDIPGYIKSLQVQIEIAKLEMKLSKSKLVKRRLTKQISKLEDALVVLTSADFVKLIKARIPNINKIYKDLNKIKPYKVKGVKANKALLTKLLEKSKTYRKLKKKLAASKKQKTAKAIKKVSKNAKKVSKTKKYVPSRLPKAKLSKLSNSALAKLSTSQLSRLPAKRLSRLPASKLSKLPKSKLSRLPVSALSKLPASTLSKLPSSTLSKLPSSTLSKLPASKLSKLPSSTLSKLPSSTLSKLPSSRLSKLPKGKISKLPKSKLSKLPKGKRKKPFGKISSLKNNEKLPYIVFVKKRGAKKRYMRVNKQKYKRNDAINLGRYLIDNTALASYVIKPTTGKITSKFSKKTIAKKFRNIKSRSKLPRTAAVEKRKYRIDTKGEKAGITTKGLSKLKTQKQIVKAINNKISRTKRRKNGQKKKKIANKKRNKKKIYKKKK